MGLRPQRQLRGSQKQQGVSRELGVGRAPNFGPKAIRKSSGSWKGLRNRWKGLREPAGRLSELAGRAFEPAKSRGRGRGRGSRNGGKQKQKLRKFPCTDKYNKSFT